MWREVVGWWGEGVGWWREGGVSGDDGSMAGSDDEIEKLLREVDGALGGKPSAPVERPASGPAAVKDGTPPSGGRFEQALLPAVAVGAICAAPVWVVFSILPFVSGMSGGLGAFVAGFSVSLVGRVRRGG